MIMLMSERSFYITVLDTDYLFEFWRNMWLPDEFNKIHDRLVLLHESSDLYENPMTILKILSGLSLRCDMLNYGWNMIKRW